MEQHLKMSFPRVVVGGLPSQCSSGAPRRTQWTTDFSTRLLCGCTGGLLKHVPFQCPKHRARITISRFQAELKAQWFLLQGPLAVWRDPPCQNVLTIWFQRSIRKRTTLDIIVSKLFVTQTGLPSQMLPSSTRSWTSQQHSKHKSGWLFVSLPSSMLGWDRCLQKMDSNLRAGNIEGAMAKQLPRAYSEMWRTTLEHRTE